MERSKTTILVFLLSFALLVPWLGNKDFYSRGEPREALVMQSIQDGEWILPQGYGGAVPSKPPLMHWVSALAAQLSGTSISEFTARLPSALGALLFVCFFFSFLAKERGAETSFASVLILLTSVEWFRAAISARVDMLLSALLCGGLILLYSWYKKGFKGYPVCAVLCFTGATLTKGPVSFVLPAGIFALFLLLRNVRFGRILWVCFITFIPVILLAGVWYVAAASERPDAFADKFYYENVQRFLGTQYDEPHKHSAAYLILTLFIGFLPWTFLYSKIFISSIKKVRISDALNLSLKAGIRKKLIELNPFVLFSALTVICFIVFFSFPTGKRSVYLLPAYPFLAWWLSEIYAASTDKLKLSVVYLGRFLSALILCLYLLAFFAISDFDATIAVIQRYLDPFRGNYVSQAFRALSDLTYPLQLLLTALPLVFSLGLFNPRALTISNTRGLVLCGALVFTLELLINAILIPPFANAISPRKFCVEIAGPVAETDILYSFNNEYYGVSFYLKKPMQRYEEARPEHGFVLLRLKDLGKFKSEIRNNEKVEVLKVSSYGLGKPQDVAALVRF